MKLEDFNDMAAHMAWIVGAVLVFVTFWLWCVPLALYGVGVLLWRRMSRKLLVQGN